jgi:NadR type nicotinamide-nucleotide adenylyltransferase
MEKTQPSTSGAMRIVITGPESCGKTTLSKRLSAHFNCQWIPEYARGYVENLDRPYTYDDVEIIAKQQIKEYHLSTPDNALVIYDTALIITRVWFDFVFNRIPQWLDEAILTLPYDLYLLCYPDIEWEPDPVRENKYDRRLLFNTYKDLLEANQFQYRVITGQGDTRTQLAIQEIEKYYNNFSYEPPEYLSNFRRHH